MNLTNVNKEYNLNVAIDQKQYIMNGKDILNFFAMPYSANKYKNPFYCEHLYGVYLILNNTNNKFYIGSAVDIYRRWRDHVTELRSNSHHSKYLQNSWDAHAPENYEFYILNILEKEQRTRENLLHIEQQYLDTYTPWDRKNGYNISKKATGPVVDVWERFYSRKLKLTVEKREQIIYYLMETNLNLREISEKVDLKYTMIKDIYQHRTYKELFVDFVFPERSGYKDIEKHHWDEIYSLYLQGMPAYTIAKKLGFSGTQICRILNNNIDEKLHGHRTQVFKYDIYGNLLGKYNSIVEAKKETIDVNCIILSRGDKLTIVGNKYIFTNKPIREKTIIETIIGCYMTNENLVIVQYSSNYIPLKAFKMMQEINQEGLSSSALGRRFSKKEHDYAGYYWYKVNEVPEEDLQHLLKLKQNSSLIESENKLKNKKV